MNLNEVWNKILEEIKPQIKEIEFNSWIKPLVPISLFSDSLVVSTQSELARDMIINRKFFNIIKNALAYVTGANYEFKIVVGDEKIESNTIINANVQQSIPNDVTSSDINPKYTFENFVVGNSNNMAHATSFAVAESPANAYNPLFLYGGAGLGKTHLMNAIANKVRELHPELKVVYVSSEKFTNDLINALKDDKTQEFRDNYRTVDVLLVDDVQFIGGKESTQMEFFHTFNELHAANKQIVLTSDRPPKEINTLEERLRTRFEWGLAADIQPPDYETRIAIMKKKAQIENYQIEDDVFIFMAERVKSNIRQLEGALTRIVTYAKISNKKLTPSLADEALTNYLPDATVLRITESMIKSSVCKYYNIDIVTLDSKKKTKDIALARQVAMYLCRTLTDMSFPAIGQAFGGRDHSTVMHAAEKISKDCKVNTELANIIDFLIKDIKTI